MSVERASQVLVIYRNPLFAHSIRAALQSHPEVAVVGEIDQWSLAEAAIARLEPDVIVIEEAEDGSADLVLRALSARESPWRLVAMRLDETSMHILSGTWQPVTCAQDLIDALGGAHSPRPNRPAPRAAPGRDTNGER